jgi:hypothetical protein
MNFHPVPYTLLPAKTSPLSERIAARIARNEEDKRALLALALVNGDPIPRLSERQAARMTKTSRHKVRSAKLATAADIELVKIGRLRLSDVRRMRAKARVMTDAEIENFIDRADPVRVLAYLDRLTAPQPQLVAAE